MAVSSMQLGRVSIVMPTYNYGRYLRDSILSVMAQDYSDWELLVIDDGSTDDTPTILASLTDELKDERIRVTRLQNGGVSRARNVGLDAATGEFIAFLDADDLWMPNKLSRQITALAAFPSAGFVFTNFVRFQNSGERLADQFTFMPELANLVSHGKRDGNAALLEGDAFSALLRVTEMPWYPTSNLARRSAIGALRFDVARKIAEDVDFFARIWLDTQAVAIFEVLCELRRHGNNASHVLQTPHQINLIDVLSGIPAKSARQHAERDRRIGREWASLGYVSFAKGEVGKAARAYARALKHSGSRRSALVHLAALPYAWIRNRR